MTPSPPPWMRPRRTVSGSSSMNPSLDNTQIYESMDEWAQERYDLLERFASELEKATGDGSKKRQSGEKPPWYKDDAHEAAIFSHLNKWKHGELVDKDSGAHPLV